MNTNLHVILSLFATSSRLQRKRAYLTVAAIAWGTVAILLLLAFGEGLRTAGRSVRFDEVDVRAETTEAWQDGDRDYVTAYVAGSMLSHTLEDATGHIVEGSRTKSTAVEAFLTFTRPAGLNFWMLSIIQGA